jgi:polygalacturonase
MRKSKISAEEIFLIMNKSPAIFNAKEFGAHGNGVSNDTTAIQAAIAACSKAGGGTVHVPSGTYLCGALILESNIDLHLEAGAILHASARREDFGSGDGSLKALISARDAANVSITGRGTIDGQGAPWWKEFLDWRESGRHRPADPGRPMPGAPHRPRTIFFERCSNVRAAGITVANTPSWALHMRACEDVIIDSLHVLNPPGHPHGPSVNTDGINHESCRNVRITNCFVSVGDDNITLKAGTEHGSFGPCENISISNCICGAGHGGVVVGCEMSGGVRDVTISNCIFNGTYRGLRLKTRRGRGGVVENITASNIIMHNVPFPFFLDQFFYDFEPDKKCERSSSSPLFRNISFSDIIADGARKAGHIVGLGEQPIAAISFSNVSVRAKRGFICKNADSLSMRNIRCTVEEGPPLLVQNVSQAQFDETIRAVEGEVNDTSGQYMTD